MKKTKVTCVTFDALIKEIKVKSLVSLDKGCRVILDFDGSDTATIKKLIELQKADEYVMVTIG